MNKVILVGRVAETPSDSTNAVSFSVITNSQDKDPEAHSVTVFKAQPKTARQAGRLAAGQLVYVEGNVKFRRVETRERVRYYTEVVASRIGSLSN